MKKLFLVILSLLVGLALFVWILRMVGWQAIIDALLVFTGWQGLVILGLTGLMMVLGTWKWKEILKGMGENVSFKSLFAPYLAGFAAMFLVPILVWGGEFFRSYVLKDREDINFKKGMASVIVDRILEWTVNLIVIFFGALFFLLTIGLPSLKLIVIFGGVFLVLLIALIFFYFKSVKRESMLSIFLRNNNQPFEVEKEIFNFFKLNKSAFWKALAISFLRVSVMYFRTWLLISFLVKGIGLLPALSILGFTYLAMMIPIPAALGSHEAIQIFAFNSLALGGSAATAFTMIIRGAELLVALFGLALFFRLGVIVLKSIIFKRIDRFTKHKDPSIQV